MHNYFNINISKISENLIVNLVNSVNPGNILQNKENIPSNNFSSLLNEQLNAAQASLSDPIIAKSEEIDAFGSHELNNFDIDFNKISIDYNTVNKNHSQRVYTDRDSISNAEGQSIERNRNSKKDDKLPEKNSYTNKLESTPDIDVKNSGNNERIVKNEAKSEKKTDNIAKKTLRNDPLYLLNELSYFIDSIKNVSGKKQLKEIKSELDNFKNSIGIGNVRDFKNIRDGLIDLANLSDVKKLFEKLAKLLESQKDRMAGINNKWKETLSIPDKSELSEINNLKKQITKLAEDIKHLLSEKKENIISKKDEHFAEKQDINQKLFSESHKNDRIENHSKDNNNNFSFDSFNRKDFTDKSGRHDAAAALKKNSFNDQFETIVRNAKVVIRDGNNGSFSIKLHPESLGRVNVNLNLEHGVIVGKFLVDSAEAKNALLENINNVMESLQGNGIAVGEFQVNVRDDNKYFQDYEGENLTYNTGINKSAAPLVYEINSHYSHDGEIDYLI